MADEQAKSTVDDRYFYHSFPRRGDKDPISKGMAILESILKHGLLLTYEDYKFSELRDGNPATFICAQKRVCFTELHPSELSDHAKTFGQFAIEWDTEMLIKMGALPVMYIPQGVFDAMGGIGPALMARLADTTAVLDQMNGQKVDLGGGVVRDTNELASALRALAGFFYPTDNAKYTEPLGYYRQREWRIVANMLKHGIATTPPCTDDQYQDLLAIDKEFFGKMKQFRSGSKELGKECQFYSEFEGASIAATFRRIVCPDHSKEAVIGLLQAHGVVCDVVSLETLS